MYKRYGFLGSLRLLISLIFTKVFYRKSRLVRLPFDIRNGRYIDLGIGLTTGFGCRFEAFPTNNSGEMCLKIGENVQVNDYVHIAAGEEIKIGNNVLIASKVFISDINHGNYNGPGSDRPDVVPNDRKLSTKPIFIDDNVWIGEGCCIMAGVKIGFGSIIGALSVVTKDIPANCIAIGSPAKIIKTYNFELAEWIKV